MSPRTQEATEALHEERRGLILATALEAFVERGFEGTRIQEIADRAKLSYGLVYHYFPSKEAIFTVLVETALDAATELIEASLGPRTRPEAFGRFVECAMKDPAPPYFVMIIEALTKKGVPQALARRARSRVEGFIRQFAEACPSGEGDTAMAARTADGILALLLGTSLMRVCGLSDGLFAPEAAVRLAAIAKE